MNTIFYFKHIIQNMLISVTTLWLRDIRCTLLILLFQKISRKHLVDNTDTSINQLQHCVIVEHLYNVSHTRSNKLLFLEVLKDDP